MKLSKTEMLRQAQQLIDQGRVSSAIPIYQKIVDGDSADLNSISMLGALYVKAGRGADAVDHFMRIADKYLQIGSAASATYVLKKVIRIDPANPVANMHLGELQVQDKAIDSAHNYFIEAGAAFWHKGNIPAAIKMNKRALEIMPESRQAKAALALIQQETEPAPVPKPKKQEITRDLPEIIISIADGSDTVCAPMEQLETQLPVDSTSDAALETQKEFLPARDEDGLVQQIAIAEYLVGCGQVDQAIRVLREGLLDNPDHIPIREKLKDIYLRSEMMDRASEECVNIAGIYLARGETSRASDYVWRARVLSQPVEPAPLRSSAQASGSKESDGVQGMSSEPGPERRPMFTVM